MKKTGLEIIKANFRPVSNMPYASKLIERAVANQLVQHMVENDLFEPLKSAYREGHSTEIALSRVQNDLLMATDKQKVSILGLLDLSAAFDTVNHSVLLERLSNRCRIKGDALKWFVSYLKDRFQMVKVKAEKSKRGAPILWCSTRISAGSITFSRIYVTLGRHSSEKRYEISLLC